MPRLFTVRAMVFGVVLLMAFVLVYPTFSSYVRQQSALSELRAQVAAAQSRNDDLEADVKRWDDPAYVVAQARERLSFVLPGETPYRVVDPQTVPDATVTKGSAAADPDAGTTRPWYTTVWGSVRTAGELPVGTDTSGATKGTSGG